MKTHQAGGFKLITPHSDDGLRLDSIIAAHIAHCSRSRAVRSIRSGNVYVNGRLQKPGYHVRTGDKIQGSLFSEDQISIHPVPIKIDVIFEDTHIVIINKPPGLVVHPAHGHTTDTLVNGLVYQYPELEKFDNKERPGIIHRLDKDTSGLLVVARTETAQENLLLQFKKRWVKKTYLALVNGHLSPVSGSIRFPIGRDPVHRKKMSIRSDKPRRAVTCWQVKTYYAAASFVEVDLETGRTHQIRVHFSAIGHPVLGDTVYGHRRMPKPLVDMKKKITRQMLHAWRLSFYHPKTDRWMAYEAPIPGDMAYAMETFAGSFSEKINN